MVRSPLASVALLLYVALGGALSPAPAAARPAAEPTLNLAPNQAPCGAKIVARGTGFPAGGVVEVVVSGGVEKPTGPPVPTTVPVAADGTFAVALSPCVATAVAPDGTQYAVSASTPTADPFAPPAAFARAVYTVGPAGQRPIPTLTLSPEAGACNGPAVVAGANWFPGDTLSLTAFPEGGRQGVGFAEVVVAADGTFSFAFELQRATRCSASAAPPIGARYQISAGPPFKRASPRLDSASAIYTIVRERLTGRCFAETGRCVRGSFYDRWERYGLAGNGYPLSDEFEQLLEDGQTYRVQYFERVRLEYHPENQPPYDLLLGQFGRRIVATVPGAPVAPVAPQGDGAYFPETGHNVDARFLAYWTFNGGLEQFGFPLTEAFDQRLEDGTTYRVQYFERARFEYHPENTEPYQVLLGQFGRQILAETVPGGR